MKIKKAILASGESATIVASAESAAGSEVQALENAQKHIHKAIGELRTIASQNTVAKETIANLSVVLLDLASAE